jgi:hypothetical protein
VPGPDGTTAILIAQRNQVLRVDPKNLSKAPETVVNLASDHRILQHGVTGEGRTLIVGAEVTRNQTTETDVYRCRW